MYRSNVWDRGCLLYANGAAHLSVEWLEDGQGPASLGSAGRREAEKAVLEGVR